MTLDKNTKRERSALENRDRQEDTPRHTDRGHKNMDDPLLVCPSSP